MDVESAFRVNFGVRKEQDIVGLIEAAVNVAAMIVPHKLKKHRSRIVKLLFDEDPANSTDDFFSDDELGFDSDEEEDEKLLKVTSTPKDTLSHSLEIIKKTVEEELFAPPQMPLMMVSRQDKWMEKTKKVMLGRKYPEQEEEAEKKAKKRRIDFSEPKKHCCDSHSSKAKPLNGHVRQPQLSRMKARQHDKLKPKSRY